MGRSHPIPSRPMGRFLETHIPWDGTEIFENHLIPWDDIVFEYPIPSHPMGKKFL
jgi:hypothetical protein